MQFLPILLAALWAMYAFSADSKPGQVGPGSPQAANTPAPNGGKPSVVLLKNAAGAQVGTASLEPVKKGRGVQVHLVLEGLPPGQKAVHFHEKGECEGPKFSSAGSHLAAPSEQHGFRHARGPHSGDLPNVKVGPDGRAEADFVAEKVTLGPGPASLLREGGTALVVHSGPDDYRSQPAGNSGDRIACGVIQRNPAAPKGAQQ